STAIWSNTFDAVTPASSVGALPPTTTTPSFTVAWSGTDDALGSGIASYTISPPIAAGPSPPCLPTTQAPTALNPAAGGHTYAFYSVATDNAGNAEAAHVSADAQTSVVSAPVRPPTRTPSRPPTRSPSRPPGDTNSVAAVAMPASLSASTDVSPTSAQEP